MAVVHHDGYVPAGVYHLLEQAKQVVGVLIGHEPVGPVCGGLRADADARNVVQRRMQQRLDVATEQRRLHDHWIAAREQHARNLGMRAKVSHQGLRLAVGELEPVEADKLRPAKAVRAVGVTCLPRSGEKQQRLTVLVLHARHGAAVQLRHVQFHLPSRVRVEGVLHRARRCLDCVFGRLACYKLVHAVEIPPAQHLRLRKRQLVHGIAGNVRPVDQILDDVVVHPERQNRRHRPHSVEIAERSVCELRNLIDVSPREHSEATCVGRRVGNVALLKRQ